MPEQSVPAGACSRSGDECGGEQLAPAGIPEESPVEMESEADSGLSGGKATPGSRIIRSVYLSLSSRQFADDLDRLKTVIREKNGYVESSDLSADARSRRYASITARIPSENLDSFLASAKGIGYMTSFSESGEDVSEQYTDTEARLQTQRNKMERLQALLAQADAVEDLLAIETEIANTQYQIDSLTGALQGYDSRINYSAVTIDLAEESMTPSRQPAAQLMERITDAVRDAFAGMVMFLEDMVVLLAIVLPYIACLLSRDHRRDHCEISQEETKMKKIVSIALALLLLAPILPGFAQDANRVIKVTGTATVSLMADTATIQIGTNTKADTVSKAQSENNTIMQKVIAALEREGIAKEDIVTSYYDVSMRMDQVFGDSTADQAGNMYEVSNMLYVTIKDLDKLVQAIDSALAAGANSIYDAVFSSSKSTEAYHTALQRAVEMRRLKQSAGRRCRQGIRRYHHRDK